LNRGSHVLPIACQCHEDSIAMFRSRARGPLEAQKLSCAAAWDATPPPPLTLRPNSPPPATGVVAIFPQAACSIAAAALAANTRADVGGVGTAHAAATALHRCRLFLQQSGRQHGSACWISAGDKPTHCTTNTAARAVSRTSRRARLCC
jgi:hypothetical protein